MFAEGSEMNNFLPFPLEKQYRVSKTTAKVFLRLLKTNAIPPRALAFAGSLIEEMKEQLKNE